MQIGGVAYSAAQMAIAGGVVAGTFLVGVGAYPLVKKIIELAKVAFTKIAEYFSKIPFVVRFKSLFCDDCAIRHRMHMDNHRYATEQVD
jgi:hypothetical protein